MVTYQPPPIQALRFLRSSAFCRQKNKNQNDLYCNCSTPRVILTKVNTKNLIININFLDYYFNNNKQDPALPPIFLYGLRQLYNYYTFRSRYTFGFNFNYALSQDTPVTPYTCLLVSTAISAIFVAISATSAISVIFAIPETSAIPAPSTC